MSFGIITTKRGSVRRYDEEPSSRNWQSGNKRLEKNKKMNSRVFVSARV